VAILLVVLYHCRVISGGYVGVDVFFVISGFLITRQLVRELERTGSISLRGFYARRARRILPAATVTTVATVMATGLLMSPLPALQTFSDARNAALFSANFHFAALHANYFDASLAPSPFEHYWSLSVEEQFYVFWPLVLLISAAVAIRLLRANRRRASVAGQAGSGVSRRQLVPVAAILAGLAVASLAYSVLLTGTSPIQAYYSPMSRGWELATGALLALGLVPVRRVDPRAGSLLTWIGLLCIGVAALSFSQATKFPGAAALLPVLGAAAVIFGSSTLTRNWSAQVVLGTTPFQRIGDWSYSWYLWHWPVLVLAPSVLGHSLSRLEAIAMAGLSLLLAILSFHLIERPTRRLRGLVRRPSLGVSFGALLVGTSIAVIAVSGALASVSSGPHVTDISHSKVALTPARLSRLLSRGVNVRRVPSNLVPSLTKAPSDIPIVSGNGCLVLDSGTRSHGCVYGDKSSHTTVVLFGDSHAAAWFPAVNRISQQHHWRLVFRAKAGCPVADVLVSRHGGPYQTCVTWRKNTLNQIAHMDPALVIATSSEYINSAKPVSGVPTGEGSTWLDGTAYTFNRLRQSARRVVYIADVPHLQQPGAYCVSNHVSDVRACTIARSQAFTFPRVRKAEMRLAQADHIAVVDPENWFCAPKRCPVIVGNILVYRDAQHMIPQWSRFLAPVLADKLVPIMASPGS
jgi:peptidoglycan/LPS O-acetylase OafA/YrhL